MIAVILLCYIISSQHNTLYEYIIFATKHAHTVLHTIHTNRTLEFLRLDFPNKVKPRKVKEPTQTAEIIQILHINL